MPKHTNDKVDMIKDYRIGGGVEEVPKHNALQCNFRPTFPINNLFLSPVLEEWEIQDTCRVEIFIFKEQKHNQVIPK